MCVHMYTCVEAPEESVFTENWLVFFNSQSVSQSVQSLSRVWLFATPWIAAHQASLSITNSRSSLRLMSIESVMSSSHLILCRPLLLLPPIPPRIRVLSIDCGKLKNANGIERKSPGVSLIMLMVCCSPDGKESAYDAGDPGSIPGSGRYSGEGNGKPLQYSRLENPMDRGDWRAAVFGVTQSWTWLSD